MMKIIFDCILLIKNQEMRTSMTTFAILFLLLGEVQSQIIDYVDSIQNYARSNDFSGSILVVRKQEQVFKKSFGFANRPFKVQNSDDTKYKIASITKLFTSVLIMRLADRGMIDLEATIERYYPEYPGEGAGKTTIHQLLNHTSGLPYFGPTSKDEALNLGMVELQLPHTLDSLIVKYHSQDLVNDPGTVFNYNNGDYLILGKIIENIEQKRFGEVLKAEILVPLHLDNTGLLYQYEIEENLADSYFTMDDSIGLVNDLPVYIQNWYTAGAMYSTIFDLQRFASALYSGELISKKSLANLLTPGLDEYGYGLWIYDLTTDDKKYKVYKRPGDIMGSKAMLVHMPDEQVTISILANTDLVNLDDFVRKIMLWIIKSQD